MKKRNEKDIRNRFWKIVFFVPLYNMLVSNIYTILKEVKKKAIREGGWGKKKDPKKNAHYSFLK